MQESSKIKKSIILSGLVGTGGMFIAKLIGIVYAIPFSSILGSDVYMGIYGQAYNIYSYVLSVFTAGFPFAIATLVARYTVLKDAHTVLLIRKIAFVALALMGFAGMLLMFGLSGILAPLMVAQSSDVMARSLQILSLAIFFVPVLSALRGFYQGRKEMEQYAFSQAFEQVFRVGFLLSISCLFVYVLGLERKWALYVSVFSTSVAAIAAIVQFLVFDKHKKQEILLESQAQTKTGISQKKIAKEMFILAIPYMISAIFGYSQQIFNAILLPTGLHLHQYDEATISTIISATNYVGVKITAIPMILAPGFTAAIIPHITEALTRKDWTKTRKNVVDCLNVVLTIGIPVAFCIFLYAGPINYTLFYTENLDMSSYVLSWLSIEGFLGTISPVTTNLMMALGLKRTSLRRMMISTIIKGVLMVPLTAIFGFAGSVLTSIVGDGYLIIYNLKEVRSVYQIRFHKTLQIISRLLIVIASMFIVCTVLNWIGLHGVDGSKWIAFIKMAFNGLLTVGVGVVVACYLRLPQVVFHIRIHLPRRKEV